MAQREVIELSSSSSSEASSAATSPVWRPDQPIGCSSSEDDGGNGRAVKRRRIARWQSTVVNVDGRAVEQIVLDDDDDDDVVQPVDSPINVDFVYADSPSAAAAPSESLAHVLAEVDAAEPWTYTDEADVLPEAGASSDHAHGAGTQCRTLLLTIDEQKGRFPNPQAALLQERLLQAQKDHDAATNAVMHVLAQLTGTTGPGGAGSSMPAYRASTGRPVHWRPLAIHRGRRDPDCALVLLEAVRPRRPASSTSGPGTAG